MAPRKDFESAYRSRLFDILRSGVTISRYQAIYAGAESAGCSPVTSQRYLRKLISAEGPCSLLWEYDRFGRRTEQMVVFKGSQTASETRDES